MTFEFKCATCGETHKGMPSFGSDKPASYYELPEAEREERCECAAAACVIDKKWFFVRGCIEIPVHGQKELFIWGVWVSLSEESFTKWKAVFDKDKRSHIGPLFGWLNTWLQPYPDTRNLKTKVHLRDHGVRPYIELEPTEHPLAVEQREGISEERVAQLYSMIMHS